MKKIACIALLCACMITAACAPAQSSPAYTRYSAAFFDAFDTVIQISAFAPDQQTFDRVYGEMQAMFTRYHAVYDGFLPHEGVKGLYYVNANAAKAPVEVEPELMELLLFCRDHQPETQGTVNIALGAVLAIWHDYREDGLYDPMSAELPPMARLEAAARHINFEDCIIDEAKGTVYFADPALRLDLGAVAKGYATEKVAQYLLESEMPSFILSAGGNVRMGNPPLDGRQRWGVGIQNPDASIFNETADGLVDTLFMADGSIVTSGDYQRYYVVGEKRYHHLISPFTLMPADLYRSVTVVCEDSGMADLLSTCFFILPYEEGRALADSMDGVEVMWLLNDEAGTVQMTEGLKAMSKNNGASSRD
jgi:thiamine biosynthesis lipoprotein